MNLSRPILNIYFLLMLIVLSTGCAVVKSPYFQADYYQETAAALDELKPAVKQVNDSLYAGFSKRNIIPDMDLISPGKKNKQKEIPIAGYGQMKTKYATGIHDSVFVRAVALRAGTQTSIIVSAEMLIMPPNIIDSVVMRLNKEGFGRDQLFFTATHTHSGIGGWGYGLLAKLMAGKRNRNIEKWLVEQITQATVDAVTNIQPASLGTSSFDAPEYTRNRLTGNPLHNNTSFDYIVIEQLYGKKAVIGTYSAHSTTTSRKNTLISGDYPGYWSRKIEASGADIAMFCGGSMGGQSPAGRGNEFESAAFIGESLADSVLAGMEKINLDNMVSASAISLRTSLPEYHFRMTPGLNFSTWLSEKLMAAPENVYLQALRMNNLIWFFTPGDFSGESAVMLRRLLRGKGYRSVVTGYNGSYVGYIIPSKYFYLDHYEPRTMSWFGPALGDYILDLMDQMSRALISGK